jgi:hypothetical protein
VTERGGRDGGGNEKAGKIFQHKAPSGWDLSVGNFPKRNAQHCQLFASIILWDISIGQWFRPPVAVGGSHCGGCGFESRKFT